MRKAVEAHWGLRKTTWESMRQEWIERLPEGEAAVLAPMMGHSCMRAELQEGHTHTQGHSEELGAFLREVRSP